MDVNYVIDKLNYKQFNQDFLQQQLILSLKNQASEGCASITRMIIFLRSDATLAFYLSDSIVR